MRTRQDKGEGKIQTEIGEGSIELKNVRERSILKLAGGYTNLNETMIQGS